MQYSPTPRTAVRRLKKRAVYDKVLVHAILDEGFVCHVGFNVGTQPYVIPTVYARDDEHLYFHGAMASRMLQTLSSGVDVCVTVTLVDGLVLARCAFNHSVNYRSVVMLGTAVLVADTAQRMRVLELITNRIVPNRWAELRAPNELELKQTLVLGMALQEVSAKVRTGPPVDEAEDYALPVWAGVLPIESRLGTPLSDGRLLPEVTAPDLKQFSRLGARKD